MKQKLFYSCISGYGVYEMISDENRVLGIGLCCQMKHLDTKVNFYAVHQGKNNLHSHTIQMIERRIPDRQWIWPCDQVESAEGDVYLLFAPDSYPQYQTVWNVIKGKQGLDNLDVLKVLSWLLDRWDVLWSNGYITANFDFEDYYYDLSCHEGYITSSDMTTRKINAAYKRHNQPYYILNSISRIAKSRGFVDPFGFSEDHEQYRFDNNSFLVAVASAIFYLLVGRMPYDGSLQDDERYDMELNPGRFWGHNYPYHPYFIMDEEDRQHNSIGVYPEEQVQIERYQRLSPKLQKMFCYMLRHDNVMRKQQVEPITPSEWKQALAEWYRAYQTHEDE